MKRRKATAADLTSIKAYYYNSFRVKLDNGTRGTAYILNNSLTAEQRDFINKFDNVHIGYSRCQYAPEIKHDAVILFDKCIK